MLLVPQTQQDTIIWSVGPTRTLSSTTDSQTLYRYKNEWYQQRYRREKCVCIKDSRHDWYSFTVLKYASKYSYTMIAWYNDSLYHEVNIESKLYSSHATIRLEASWCHFNAISRHSRHNRPPHHDHLHQQQLIKAFKQTHCNALEHKYQTRQQILVNTFYSGWIVLQITLLYVEWKCKSEVASGSSPQNIVALSMIRVWLSWRRPRRSPSPCHPWRRSSAGSPHWTPPPGPPGLPSRPDSGEKSL